MQSSYSFNQSPFGGQTNQQHHQQASGSASWQQPSFQQSPQRPSGGQNGFTPGLYNSNAAAGGASMPSSSSVYMQQQSQQPGQPAQQEGARKYMPGYLTSNYAMSSPTRLRPEEYEYGSSPAHVSPVMTQRSSVFGPQASTSRDTPSRIRRSTADTSFGASTYGSHASPQRNAANALFEDAPPISSLDDTDDLPVSYAKDTSMTLSTSPAKNGAEAEGTESYRVHVFGFTVASLDAVLDHFGSIGDMELVESCPEGGNWITLAYKEAWAAARAVRRNGEIIGGLIMIGAKWADSEPKLAPAVSATNGTVQDAAVKPVDKGPISSIGQPIPLATGSPFRTSVTSQASKQSSLLQTLNSAGTPTAKMFADREKALTAGATKQQTLLSRVSDLVFGY
ncbi:uncharacterized protein L969DRAFT_102984 [Mixia osmundae IAM 14324]|uniref:RRM Nup35-type domain-containing protein n=1 Tax=Mixia osmundae (strain CBS 9802 / IAM 14324 / JCM 22182 / KY 12970) TaxID=764103 RepID=G7E935_MIXOS|nr:uncharacterized protein L969DRAFT_102984 [Mixia osmundae IAM 14324]KEI40289.1 hypothetical protein L969DRAFT_102984 [Mixia osmundae IAM 14324]GAA99653.1 hypothetical protein E5Q_06356 [Mixia osmundae IAM 14324]